jgi:hypothetical protein
MARREFAWSRVLRHGLLAGVLLAPFVLPAAMAQSPSTPSNTERAAARQAAVTRNQQRAEQVRPAKRDTPARATPLSNDEIEDIKRAVAEILPDAAVSIGPVVTGCPCEDSDFCTDQVWVTATAPGGTRGLLLSKIVNQWKVGFVQDWWLDYEALQARRARYSPQDYRELESDVYARFPACSPPMQKADAAPAPP